MDPDRSILGRILGRIAASLLLLVMALAAPSGRAQEGAPLEDEVRQQIVAGCARAELVLVAEVVEADLSPGAWSGGFFCTRRVRYRVLEVLRGEPPRPLDIEVGLIGGPGMRCPQYARGADGEALPQLDAGFFAPGARHLVLARRHDLHATGEEEDLVSWGGPFPVTPAAIEAARTALGDAPPHRR